VIKVENLSKRYVIGHQRQERYSTLRDAIANGARSLKQKKWRENFYLSVTVAFQNCLA